MRDTIFFSYCHANRKWLTTLRNTLKPALKNRPVRAWADTDSPVQHGAQCHSPLFSRASGL